MRRSSRNKLKEKTDTATAVTIDLSQPQHGFSYSEASKHRSCWMHILARKLVQGNKWTSEELDIFKKSSPCFRQDIPGRCRSNRHHKCKVLHTGPKGKLDSTTFHTYFRMLWDKFPEDKKALFAYLDCLWFGIYSEPASRQKVLSWIKKTAILSKRFVIIPIVLWDHWNLLILCNFDGSLESSIRKPCMLLLDSLENAAPTRYQPVVRKFLVDVFQALGRTETKKILSKIPLLLPKVPQQTNDVECGNFVLYFIHLFVNAAPEVFDISNGHLNFMNDNWFNRQNYENFCSQLVSPCRLCTTD